MLLLTMQVKILPFGVLKDWLGASATNLELPEGATVADLLKQLASRHPARTSAPFQGIAVSVNAEYAQATQVLRDGDEVGLLPPVSGGTTRAAGAARTAGVPEAKTQEPSVVIALTREPINAEKLVAAAKRGEDGAVVVFDGIVRNHSRGRQTLYLDYEAYEAMAVRQMGELARDVIGRFGVRHVTLVHRLGRLQIGETSVLIVVASAHRGQAFDACRWLIDTLKKTVPIWKKETFVDGVVWADGEPFPDGLSVPATEAEHGS
jgi:molybdopterin synthase catalytic subunit